MKTTMMDLMQMMKALKVTVSQLFAAMDKTGLRGHQKGRFAPRLWTPGEVEQIRRALASKDDNP